MTALSVFCIIAVRLPCQPVAHHRVSGYWRFSLFLLSGGEKTQDMKYMLKIIVHNKNKKKKHARSLLAQCSFTDKYEQRVTGLLTKCLFRACEESPPRGVTSCPHGLRRLIADKLK